MGYAWWSSGGNGGISVFFLNAFLMDAKDGFLENGELAVMEG
jgi:hypothetical protein